jgi:glycosyltransferase involved in cell wall biosynthesis
MKLCIVTNAHHTTDVRLYYKMALSLAKLGEVHLICKSGVRNSNTNPYQTVVDTESDWYALFLIYRAALKVKPDIVICVEPLTMFIGMALRRKCGSRVVFDVHEFFADAFAERFPRPLSWLMKLAYLSFERWLWKHADATTGVNDEILDQLVPARLRDAAVTIPNYPVKHVWDYSCEMPADISTICEMNFDLIYIGGITRDRGIFKLLKAVALLKQEFPRLNVLILGRFHNAAVEKEFNDYINGSNLNAIIYYQSWLPAEKIGLLLKRSRIGLWLFNPQNRRMRKAIPLKVLEYLAAGLPVVTIGTPLMKDLVEKNRLGLCCDYHTQAIAAAVGKLLRYGGEEYRQISDRAVDMIEKHYNWEAIEPRLFALIGKLAAK